MIHELVQQNSLASQFIAELRDAAVQTDRLRFRKNMERLGSVMAYEISKILPYEIKSITTPLGIKEMNVLAEQPVIATILRAGLAMHQGFLDFFDQADNAFISAYRKHEKDGSFVIALEYVSCPDLNDRILIVNDPMLATGASMVVTMKELFKLGHPRHTHIVCAIASSEGIEYVRSNLQNITIWTGAVDEELTAKGYIVPGLGDAGDLAFGEKIQE